MDSSSKLTTEEQVTPSHNLLAPILECLVHRKSKESAEDRRFAQASIHTYVAHETFVMMQEPSESAVAKTCEELISVR